MKDRISQIIDSKSLTPSKFADIIGIQRSRISHIMSGRNNASIDVVTKIVSKFPEVDLKWLMTGEGEMMTSEINLFSHDIDTANSEVNSDIINSSNTIESSFNKQKSIKQSNKKEIERIIVFYDDSSFKEFKPE